MKIVSLKLSINTSIPLTLKKHTYLVLLSPCLSLSLSLYLILLEAKWQILIQSRELELMLIALSRFLFHYLDYEYINRYRDRCVSSRFVLVDDQREEVK